MPSLTIRNLSAETHRALKIRAARHGRSTEAEVRDILEQAARPEDRVRLGSLLAEIGREARLSPEEQAVFDAAVARDRTPAQPLDFDR
ncbi:MAG: plasmid stabilization protein [Mesorhizobium sp.]